MAQNGHRFFDDFVHLVQELLIDFLWLDNHIVLVLLLPVLLHGQVLHDAQHDLGGVHQLKLVLL